MRTVKLGLGCQTLSTVPSGVQTKFAATGTNGVHIESHVKLEISVRVSCRTVDRSGTPEDDMEAIVPTTTGRTE